jgi:hypothetical protein
MIILDTNVLSALMRSIPEPVVVTWLDAQPSASVWTTTINVFEIRYGLNILPQGKKRETLQGAFEHALAQDLENRVLDFDPGASHEAAAIAARLRAIGRPVEMRDVLIAGIVAARHGTLATRNTAHFIDTGISLVNPWKQEPG